MEKARAVLVLSPWTAGFYFGEIISGVAREVVAAGRRVVVAQTLDAGHQTDAHVEAPEFGLRVAWDHVDGVIAVASAVQAPYLHALRAAGKSIALASARVPGFEGAIAMPDNEGGTRDAVLHLLAHGHRLVGFAGNLSQADMRERYSSYHQTLVDHDIVPDPNHFYTAGDNSTLGGVQAAHAFLEQRDRPTAVVFATDRNAIAFIRTVIAAGLHVPRDVAVVGFDNIEASAFTTPSLSTVNQRFDTIGALACRLMLAQVDGTSTAVDHAPPSRVVPRGSCGCDSLDEQSRDHPAGDEHGPRATLRDTLAAALFAAVGRSGRGRSGMPGDDATTTSVESAVETLTAVVDHVLESTAEPIPAHLSTELVRLSTRVARPEVLQLVDSAIVQYLQATADLLPDEARDTTRALTALSAFASSTLWRQQTSLYLGRVTTLETSLQEEFEIGRGLLGHRSSDARTLRWLASTHVRTGMLAVWRDDMLVVEGVHDQLGVLSTTVGSVMAPESFPPSDVVMASDPGTAEAVYVIPVRADGKDWGLLAVVGPIDTATGRETYSHWASLLCAAFEQEALAESLRSNEERYGLLARAMNEGLWEWDSTARAVTFSDRCLDLLGLDATHAVEPDSLWSSRVHPADVPEVRTALQRVIRGEVPHTEVELRYRGPDGDNDYRWILTRVMPIGAGDRNTQRLLGSISNIDDRKLLEEELRRNALYDPATGLPNRRMFLERLSLSVERWVCSRVPFAVVFLDLDRFKVVNDSLGHETGDLLLRAVSDRIRGVLRTHDTAARFGGDEFAVLLDDIGPEDVPTVAKRVQDCLAEQVEINGHALWVTASMGVASSAVDYASAEDVLRDADTAMYHAKSHEPGTMSFFDSEMHDRAVHHVRLQAATQDALERSEFEVHYQPIVDLETGLVVRFEALVRWRHPERGLLGPDEFLPLMEETGLIVRLGRWIVDEVCRQIEEWRTRYDGPVTVSVNVSDREFWHAGLVEHLLTSLATHGLESHHLVVEITEGVIMRRPDLARQIMDQMHAAGLSLHIDDFGAGHSSLQTLHRYPVEALKIDKSFVQELGGTTHSRELVRAIVAMGSALGLEVIAEGIETNAQLLELREIGCVVGQGYLFNRPLPGAQAAKILGSTYALGGGDLARVATQRPAHASEQLAGSKRALRGASSPGADGAGRAGGVAG